MEYMKNIIFVALGGSFGAVSRYSLTHFLSLLIGTSLPWSTMIINLSGSLVIGFLYGLFDKMVVPVEYQLFITIGFLGAFTTFSTFTLEILKLLRTGELKLALLNVSISTVGGLGCVFLGFLLAGLLVQK